MKLDFGKLVVDLSIPQLQIVADSMSVIQFQNAAILSKLNEVLEKENQMSTSIANFGDETLQLLKQIDVETNGLADRVVAKLNAAMANTVDPATQAKIRGSIASEITALKGIAADPANPVPAPTVP